MGLKCLTETCYLSAEFLPDSFRTGLDAVRVLEEQMLAGIEPDNTEVDPAKRTPILLKRRCRNGQASYPIPGGIPGANG